MADRRTLEVEFDGESFRFQLPICNSNGFTRWAVPSGRGKFTPAVGEELPYLFFPTTRAEEATYKPGGRALYFNQGSESIKWLGDGEARQFYFGETEVARQAATLRMMAKTLGPQQCRCNSNSFSGMDQVEAAAKVVEDLLPVWRAARARKDGSHGLDYEQVRTSYFVLLT